MISSNLNVVVALGNYAQVPLKSWLLKAVIQPNIGCLNVVCYQISVISRRHVLLKDSWV